MRKTRVYVETNLTSGEAVTIGNDSFHHLSHVLKHHEGDMIHAFDGNGGYFESIIISKSKRSMTIQPDVFVKDNRESDLRLTLAQGISRGQKMDFTIQKAVELGVYIFVPIMTDRSNVKLDSERSEKRLKHWQKIIINACEQCGRNVLPTILEPVKLEEWVTVDTNVMRYVLDPASDVSVSALNQRGPEVSLICGPEGGLSDSELDLSQKNGYSPVSLGPRILRTETAAISALAVFQSRWGDI
ncbi:MAG: 16S rRNA (uracil(1498)-N(3))-methyltransferase [Gammaproteobacteria bacterium]|nr:16S rRNA (uracil(1498)-N(3))-methyltransferase [Gammaproteobacteria bacterium]